MAHRRVRVVTADEASEIERAAISGGMPARVLMERAGAAAAAEIARRFPRRMARGVAVYAGRGNNGGDGWVVAGALSAAGVRVRVRSSGAPRSEEAAAARTFAQRWVVGDEPDGTEAVVVDGLLGTGAAGPLRGDLAALVEEIDSRGARGARIVALDLPSGVDATVGVRGTAVHADLTIALGTLKRGALLARAQTGRIVVVDIGLTPPAVDDRRTPFLVTGAMVRAATPPVRWDAHKGTRGRLAIVGGAEGMAGAVALAAEGAERSGIGLAVLVVADASVRVVQALVPRATARAWPSAGDSSAGVTDAAPDAVLIGPGLGKSATTRALTESVLRGYRGPVVLDADALNVFAGDVASLSRLLGSRPAILTPHPAECGRLLGVATEEIVAERFEAARTLARAARCVVLLKGTPTVIAEPGGQMAVSAAGTPVLAVGGSGDILGGIVATLLAQTELAFASAWTGAWVHGRASELASRREPARGATLEAVLDSLGDVWAEPVPAPRPPLLAEIPPAQNTVE